MKVKDVVTFEYGKALTKTSRDTNGTVHVFGSNGISGYHSIPLTTKPCVMVGRKGAAGNVSISKVPCWPIDTTYFIYAPSSIDLEFLYHSFVFLRFSRLEKSTAIPSLSRDDAYDLEFPLPPLNEQKRIVAKIEELFSELDAGVENLKKAKEQLGVYRQSLLKQAFEGKLTEQWRKDHAAELESAETLLANIRAEREARYQQQLQDWQTAVNTWESNGKQGKKPAKPRKPKKLESLTKDEFSVLAKLPSGWKWEKLGLMTMNVEYGSSSKSHKSGSCPVLRMGNIQNGEIDWEDLVYSTNHTEIDQYKLRKGDVLFNRTNSPELVGKTAVYRGNREALFAGYLIRLNQNPAVAHSDYLSCFLNSHVAKNHGNRVKTDGVNQSNINGEKLQNYPFPYCPLNEQNEIVRILDEQFTAIDQNEKEIEAALQRAEALRQSILKKAFSGELVPQDPNDEPASILLERIRSEREAAALTKKPSPRRKKSASSK